MSTIVVALLGALGAALASGATWVVAARQRSGRVGTTEAETLWAEGKQMRSELRDETVLLRAEVARMRVETLTLREEAIALRSEMSLLRSEAVLLRAESAACKSEVARLQGLLVEGDAHGDV